MLLLFALYVNGVPAYWALYACFADRIAAVYCANPDNPACHGRCHVSAATAKQERQDAPAGAVKLEKLPIFVVDIPRSEAFASDDEPYRPSPFVDLSEGFLTSVDHPPLASI